VLPIRIRLKAAGAQGQQARVKVLLENRKGLVEGQNGPLEPVVATESSRPLALVPISESAEEHLLTLQIVPEQAGDLKLVVEAEALPGEARQTNNRWYPSRLFRHHSFGTEVAAQDQ
jgi:hypothetical protein